MIDFDKTGFIEYMCSEFPVCGNPFTRELLENVVDDALLACDTDERLVSALADMVPEVTEEEITRFVNRPTKA